MSDDDLYIYIPNWSGPKGFQHYKDRDPKWIKNYTRLLSHDAYADLTFHQRGILHGLWMEYARSTRQLRGSTLTLTRRLGQRVTTRDLEALNQAGFIRLVASSALAELYGNACLEVETEKEEEPPLPPQGGNGHKPITGKELRRYTGCRITRGTHGSGFKHDPLGTDRPPNDWPYDRPTKTEIEHALRERQSA